MVKVKNQKKKKKKKRKKKREIEEEDFSFALVELIKVVDGTLAKFQAIVFNTAVAVASGLLSVSC